MKLFKPKTVDVSKKFAFRAALYRRVALKMLGSNYNKQHEFFSKEKLIELYRLESLGEGRRLSEMKKDNGYAYGKWLRDIDVKTMLEDIARGDFHPYEYFHSPVDCIHNKEIILNYLDRTKIQDTTFLKEMLLNTPIKGRGMTEGIVTVDELPYEITFVKFKEDEELFHVNKVNANILTKYLQELTNNEGNGYVLRVTEKSKRTGEMVLSDYSNKVTSETIKYPLFETTTDNGVIDDGFILSRMILSNLIKEVNSCLFPASLYALSDYYKVELIPRQHEWNELSSSEVNEIIKGYQSNDDAIHFYFVNPYFLERECGMSFKECKFQIYLPMNLFSKKKYMINT